MALESILNTISKPEAISLSLQVRMLFLSSCDHIYDNDVSGLIKLFATLVINTQNIPNMTHNNITFDVII